MVFDSIKEVFSHAVGWMELHPVFSNSLSAILGAILGVVLDFRNSIINKIKIVKKDIKKSRYTAFIFGNHNSIRQGDGSEEDIPSMTGAINEKYNGSLSKTQREICSRVKILSEKFSEVVDIQGNYEDAVKNINTNDINLAAGKFVQIFKAIANSLQAVADSNDAAEELKRLKLVADGLYQMIHKSEDEELKRQINSCEEATWEMLVKLPLL